MGTALKWNGMHVTLLYIAAGTTSDITSPYVNLNHITIRKIHAPVARINLALVSVLYHWPPDRRNHLLDTSNHDYWLDTPRNLVGLCAEPVHDRQENRTCNDREVKTYKPAFLNAGLKDHLP